ncbi:MAG: hypothetical protein ACLPYW_17480 [Acidimicrobiales bacterium]
MGLFTQLRDGAEEPEEGGDALASAGEQADGLKPDPVQEKAAVPLGEEAVAGDEPLAPHDASAADEPSWRGRLSRRGFLGGTAAVGSIGVAAYLAHGPLAAAARGTERPGLQRPQVAVLSDLDTPPIDQSYDFLIQVERDSDMLLLDFYFYNFDTRTGATGVTNIVPTSADNYIIVRMPPQAICEGVYWQDDGDLHGHNPDPTELKVDPSPILSAVSGPSQLSFTLDESDSIPLLNEDVTDLLNWFGWSLNVPAVAQAPQTPGAYGVYDLPVPPGSFDTFIEFPYCLYLSPSLWTGGIYTEGAFTTYFQNRDVPLSDSIAVGSETIQVNEIFATTLVQYPVLDNGLPWQKGLSAVWAADMDSSPGIAVVDVDQTPQEFIQYGVQLT